VLQLHLQGDGVHGQQGRGSQQQCAALQRRGGRGVRGEASVEGLGFRVFVFIGFRVQPLTGRCVSVKGVTGSAM